MDLKQTILIVDDEKANLLALNQILANEYAIHLARSGKSALELMEQNKPDMVLMDIIMPEMSGFDVLVKMKDHDELHDVPVIFITGLDNENDEETGFLLGAVDYIKKPFKSAIVQARVRTHMQIIHQMRMKEQLGMIDPLTDIPNRRIFDDRIVMEWRRAMRKKEPLSLLMMDVDKFKNYNDTYGHPQGDVLLKTVAKIIVGTTRRPGDLAARIGGEEFCALLPATDHEAANTIAENIRATIGAAIVPTADGEPTRVTISIGAATTMPDANKTIEGFISWADQLLYEAKHTGRNRICGGEL